MNIKYQHRFEQLTILCTYKQFIDISQEKACFCDLISMFVRPSVRPSNCKESLLLPKYGFWHIRLARIARACLHTNSLVMLVDKLISCCCYCICLSIHSTFLGKGITKESRSIKLDKRAQRLINLEIPVLVRSLKSSNVELG